MGRNSQSSFLSVVSLCAPNWCTKFGWNSSKCTGDPATTMAEVPPAAPASNGPAPKKMTTADFEFGEILGEGAYGAVRVVFWASRCVPKRINLTRQCFAFFRMVFHRW